MLSLHNKNILITGASSGIGREAAILTSKLGAKLFLTGRNKEGLKQTQKSLHGKKHEMFIADLKNENEISTLVKNLPALNGIVHCAGMVKSMPVKFIQQKHIDEVMQTNFNSAVLLTSQLLKEKKFLSKASMVFISSVSSAHPYRGGALYVSSKAALEAYCRTVAMELAPHKIRANSISPALVKTQIFNETAAANSKEEMEKYEKQHLLGFGEPIDVANAIAFLLSDESKWITGQNIILDGGLLLNRI